MIRKMTRRKKDFMWLGWVLFPSHSQAFSMMTIERERYQQLRYINIVKMIKFKFNPEC